MYYELELLFLLGIIALFILAPVLYRLGRIVLRLNPNWRAEIMPTWDTIDKHGLEIERLLDEQTLSTIR